MAVLALDLDTPLWPQFSVLAQSISRWQLLGGLATAYAVWLVGLVVYRLFFHPLSKYPGPFLARISNWYGFYHAYVGDRHINLYRCHQKYGDIVRMAPNLVTINKAEAIKDIYGVNRNVQKAKNYEVAPEPDGFKNTFTAIDKTVHAKRRRVLAPAFTDTALRTLEPYILEQIRSFCGIMGQRDGFVADMGQYGTWLTFEIMGSLVFGKEFGMMAGKSEESHDAPATIDGAMHYFLLFGSYPLLAQLKIDRLVFRALAAAQARFTKYAAQQTLERLSSGSERKDIMHYVMNGKDAEGGSSPPVPQLLSESRLLIIAGSDTTATAIAASFFYLTKNPSVLQRLTTELRTTFAEVEDITLGPRLDGCEYLKAVVEETLRMSPSVPGGVIREVLKGGLDVSGEHFPEGVDVSVPIHTIHHNAQYYPEPFKFRPERWLADGHQLALAQSAFHPFSIGSRGCLGKRLAYIELHLTIARAVWLYDLSYVDGGLETAFGKDVVEFKLLDHFTASKEGPRVAFSKRRD